MTAPRTPAGGESEAGGQPEAGDGPVGPVPPRRDHPGEIDLRRLRARHSTGLEADPTLAHLRACEHCQRRLDLLAQEQNDFEKRVSFERFSAGVERATRVPHPASRDEAARPRPSRRLGVGRSFTTLVSLGSLAAVLALVAGTGTLLRTTDREPRAPGAGREGTNRLKGQRTAGIEVRIAPPLPAESPQRRAAVDGTEVLGRGERLRIGVDPGTRRFQIVFTVDDLGRVSPLFPENGDSGPAPATAGALEYLPGAIELTGSGHERLVVVLSDQPLKLGAIRSAVATALTAAGGELARMGDLAVEGDQFHRTFRKP